MDNQTTHYNLKKIQSNIKNKNIFLDSYPFQVHFLMNDKCNASCIMCGGDYARSKSGRRITLDKFKKMAANLHLEYCRSVVLAGAGDPLLNKDLVSIIQLIRQTYPDMNIAVTTNGIALSEKMSVRLIENDVNSVNISINAASRPTYKRIMQVDLFDQVCRNAEKFAQLRAKAGKPATFQFSAAINRMNIEELPELVRIAKKIGISSINLFYTRFYPKHIRDANLIDPANRLDNSASLFYHQALSDKMVTQAKELAREYNIGFCHESLFKDNAPPSTCTWAYSQLMVGFDGEIYPCGGSEVHFREKVENGIYNFGNALQGPIDGFWNKEMYRDLRLSSQQGERCLVDECRCCANTMSPNDERCHIMDWEHEAPKNKQKKSDPITVQQGRGKPKQTPAPLVSVIVPTYNRPDQLAAAIRSIMDQTYGNVEIIVVNDFGIDVEHRLGSFDRPRPLTYVKHGVNQGLAASRNTGIKLARGKYIAYLDDDDLYYPDHLETLVDCLESNAVQVAYTDAYRAHQKVHNGDYVVTQRDVPYSFDFDYKKILETNFIPVLCFMHEKACVDAAGLFDESLKRLEDWDMWIRLSRKFAFAHIKKLTCEFAWRSDGSTMSSGQKDEFVRAREIIRHKIDAAPSAEVTAPKAKTIKKSMVSIVILTCNQLEYTQKCVESIRQHTPESHEIIFVDNHSTDGTRKWLKSLAAQNDNYHLVANDENLGFAKGCNQGMEIAQGEYILLLNNDVVVTTDWVSGMLECLRQDDGIGIVGPMTNSISGPQQVDRVGYSSLAKLDHYAKDFREKNRHRRIPYRRIVGFCMLFRHSLLEKIGGFDGRFGFGTYEDDDFSLRSALMGMKNMIAGDVFIHHFGSRTFIGNGIDSSASFLVNRGIFKRKWGAVAPQSATGKRLYCVTHCEKALEHAHREEWQQAVETLLDVIKVTPEAHQSYYLLAQTLMDAGQFSEALEILNAVESEDGDADKTLLTGYCQLGLEQLDQAMGMAEKALAYNVALAPALNLKGILEYKAGRRDVAQDLFNEAIAADPGYGAPYSKLGTLKWEDGDPEAALALFERGFILSATVPDVVSDYHAAINGAGAFTAGETVFREAKSLHPQNRKNAFLYIDILLQQKKNKEAMLQVEQAMIRWGVNDDILSAALRIREILGPMAPKAGPKKKDSISLCMTACNAGGHIAKSLMGAKRAVDEIIVVDTGSTDRTADIARAFGARVYTATENAGPGQARNHALSKAGGAYIFLLDACEIIFEVDCYRLRKLVAQSNKRTGFSFQTTGGAGDNGKQDADSSSVRLFPNDRRMHCLDPNDDRIEPALKKSGITIKDAAIILHHFEDEAGNRNPQRQNTGGDAPPSIDKVGEASGVQASEIEKGLQRARLFYEREEFALALDTLKKVIGVNPTHLPAFKLLVDVMIQAGQAEDLPPLMDSLAQRDDLPVGFVALISSGFEAAGDLKNAEQFALRALELDAGDPGTMNLTGVLAYREGDLERAGDLFKKAADLDSTWGDPMTNLGTVYWDQGKQDAALDALEQGFLLSPAAPNVAVAYHSAVAVTGSYQRAEAIFKQIVHRLPNFRKGRNFLIDTLLKQHKNAAAMKEIEALLLEFGNDDETIQVAKQIRNTIGPMGIEGKDAPSVSVCMIVKNEAEYIAKCLSSVKPIVDEIIVVDTGSTDGSRDIAEVFGAKVFDFDWVDDFAAARNFSLEKASGNWVLILDGDEVLSAKDCQCFKQLILQARSPYAAYSIVTRNYTHQCNTIGWIGNEGEYPEEEAGTGWTPSEKVRLFRRQPDIRFQYPVHEVVGPALKRKGVRVERCHIPIHHYGRLDLELLQKKGKKYLQIGLAKLAQMGDDIIALQELAVEAGLQGENKVAIDLWHRLLRLQGDTSRAHINLSTLFARQNDFALAVQHAQKAISLSPEMKEAGFNLALGNLHLGKVQAALSGFEKLGKKVKNYYPAILMAAACHCILGSIGDARQYVEQLKSSPYAKTLQYPIQELIVSLTTANQHELARKLREGFVALDYDKELSATQGDMGCHTGETQVAVA